MDLLTESRDSLFKTVIANTQFDLTVILENVHDQHNIGAVIRSCDAVGIRSIYILDTDDNLKGRKVGVDLSTSTGVRRWICLTKFTDVDACVSEVRKNYDTILGTHLNSNAVSIYKTDLTQSVALVFGNEHRGMTPELLNHCDGNLVIPQMGMVQSLNISVACAVSVFEAARQRISNGMYDGDFDQCNVDHQAMYDQYVKIQTKRRLK